MLEAWTQTGEPVVFEEDIKGEARGVILQVDVPTAIGGKAGYSMRKRGADSWSEWQEHAAKVGIKHLEDNTEKYAPQS